MDPRFQRRVQRYGWDRAAARYEALWAELLGSAQALMLEQAALTPGEHVLDVACGTGLVSFAAARAVGDGGAVIGVDLSGAMIAVAMRQAKDRQVANVAFERMDGESLDLPNGAFDVVLCSLGLMYLPNPEQGLREMRRVLRPDGRVALAVWGDRANCGWAEAFSIVDAEVASDVCPLFFRLGRTDALSRACADAGFQDVTQQRLSTTLNHADDDDACEAAFVGGPMALAWSHFDDAAKARVRRRYLEFIAPWRSGSGYRIPAEFVIVTGRAPE